MEGATIRMLFNPKLLWPERDSESLLLLLLYKVKLDWDVLINLFIFKQEKNLMSAQLLVLTRLFSPSFSSSCSLHFYKQISQSEVINSVLYLLQQTPHPPHPAKSFHFPLLSCLLQITHRSFCLFCRLNFNSERLKVAYHTHSSLLSLV